MAIPFIWPLDGRIQAAGRRMANVKHLVEPLVPPSPDDALDAALSAGAALAARLAALPSLQDRAAQREALRQLPALLQAVGQAVAGLEAAAAASSPTAGEAPADLADRGQLDEACAALALRHPDAPLTLIAVDIDRLRQVNDTWSRATGDAVLRAVADVLRAQSRPHDVLARLDGGRFVVALGGPVSTTRALLVAERLRAAIEARAWAPLGDGLRVSASIGVAARAPGESLDDALARAGDAVREGKRGGRNQVRFRA
jgi:diguanylate cyclase (GGDEF)-like protein